MNTSRRHFLRAACRPGRGSRRALGPQLSPPLAMSLAGLGALAAQQRPRRRHRRTATRPWSACSWPAATTATTGWCRPTPGYRASYAAARGELAWPAADVLPITSTGQGSGPQLRHAAGTAAAARLVRSAASCAVLANVGTLVRPITKADFQAGVGLPAKLFSHNDQAATWQSLSPEGAPSGWGGRMGDLLMSANAATRCSPPFRPAAMRSS